MGNAESTNTLQDVPDYDKVALHISNEVGKCEHFCTSKYRNHLNINKAEKDIYCCSEPYLYFADTTCSIGPGAKGENPVVAVQLYSDEPHKWPNYRTLECIYDRNKITSSDQAKQSIKMFGPTNPIVDAFCQTKVNHCPDYLKNGCSRYFALGEEGVFCRTIYNLLSPYEKDTVMSNYCSRYNTDDCKCANRSFNKDYVRLKQGNPFSDQCWYIPCGNETQYFTPSEFQYNSDCPSNICQIVFDISQAHDVDIEDIKADINCDFSGGKYPNKSPYLWYYLSGIALSVILLMIYARKK